MRPLPLIGLALALALTGWGAWNLYARYVGGPDAYAGADLRELDAKVEDATTSRAAADAATADLRATVDKLPAGDPRRAGPEKLLADLDAKRPDREAALEKYTKLRDERMDDARSTAARRGFLFTLVGGLWVGRAVASLRKKPDPA